MPRNYNTYDNTGGTNMVGRAYTPQVTPWDRDSDDASVQRSLRDDPQEWREDRHRAGHRKNWENREPDYRYQYNDYHRADEREMRRENQARYVRQEDASGYQRENDRDGWMSRGRPDYGREEYDRDRYNDRERYYAREDDERDRGRWNRR